MASKVSICNMALGHIGKGSITSLDERSAEARECRRFYDIVRDTLLESYPWRWAERTVALAENAVNDGGWRHSYQRPTVCLKVLDVLDRPGGQDMPYAIEGEAIYANVSPAYLHFIERKDDPTRYPALFVEAFTWELATRISIPLTKDRQLRATCAQAAAAAGGAASVADANEARETSDHQSDFIEARG